MSAAERWRDIGEVMAGAGDSDVDPAPELLALLSLRPKWMESAACRGVGVGAFFPEPGKQEAKERAKEMCRGCGVREDCLSYSVEFPTNFFGIWGGATPEERRRIRKAREAA
jgi:WhiB family transcriptional regulator, redox-sensing transcriptional regulator